MSQEFEEKHTDGKYLVALLKEVPEPVFGQIMQRIAGLIEGAVLAQTNATQNKPA